MLSMGSSMNSSMLSAFSSSIPFSNRVRRQGVNTISGLGAADFASLSQPIRQTGNLPAIPDSYEATGSVYTQVSSLFRMMMQIISSRQAADPTTGYTSPSYDGGNNGNYHGDPHLVGFDGETYDVMGHPGKTYNMLSDKDVQYNTKFEKWGNEEGATVIGTSAIQVGSNKVMFDRSGEPPTVDGKPMNPGETVKLDKGGSAYWDGEQLTVKTDEYTISLNIKDENNGNGPYLNSQVSINNKGPFSDFVAPHGLLGQTADGVKGKKDSGKDQGKQGGTVIDGTVDDYEVSDLWAQDDKFNRFGTQIGQVISSPNDGSVTTVLDANGQVVYQDPLMNGLTVAA